MFDLQAGVVFGMSLSVVAMLAAAIFVALFLIWIPIRKVPQDRREILLPISADGHLYTEMRSLNEKGKAEKRRLPSKTNATYEVRDESGKWIKVEGTVKVTATTAVRTISIPNTSERSPIVNPPVKVKLNGVSFSFRDHTQPA